MYFTHTLQQHNNTTVLFSFTDAMMSKMCTGPQNNKCVPDLACFKQAWVNGELNIFHAEFEDIHLVDKKEKKFNIKTYFSINNMLNRMTLWYTTNSIDIIFKLCWNYSLNKDIVCFCWKTWKQKKIQMRQH